MNSRHISSAHAISWERIAISVGRFGGEEPVSNVLMLNEDHPTRWGYVSLPRTIQSITSMPGIDDREIFVTLSNEGDVYFLDGDIPVEKIPGAGTLSEDSEGFGSLNFITFQQNGLFACGNGSQIYRRDSDGTWLRLLDEKLCGVSMTLLGLCLAPDASHIAACGHFNTTFRKVTPDEASLIQLAKQAGDKREYKRLRKKFRTVERRASGCLHFLNNGDLTEVPLPTRQYLHQVVCISGHQVLAVGGKGTFLIGHPSSGLGDVSDFGLTEKLRAVQAWEGGTSILGDTAIHEFDENARRVRSISLPEGMNDPVGFHRFSWGYWYFDSFGVARCKDHVWEVLTIPEELWHFEA